MVRVYHRYQRMYVYCFARPTTGDTCWLLLARVDSEVFSLALDLFCKEVGAGKDKRVLLVLDRMGFHTGKGVRVPEGVELEFLSSRSPELQPAERLWPLTNERVSPTGYSRTLTCCRRR